MFAHKGPALGLCHAGQHSSAFQRPAARPDNSGPSPLCRAGLCEQSSVDSQAALTLEEFQKWNNAGPAWASQVAARSGPRKAAVGGLPLQLCGWCFKGNPGAGRRGGGWSGCREKREELKKTQAVCEQARAPLAGWSPGEDMLVPGQAHRTGRVHTGTDHCQRSLIHSQFLDCCGSSRAAPPASRG